MTTLIPRWGVALALISLTACGTPRLTEERPAEDCAGPVTPVHAVQGPGTASPLSGQQVSVRGVVVGDFQRADQLAGFFLQDPSADDDPRTSGGLFVDATREVAAGDLVWVVGRVEERRGLTVLSEVESIRVCQRAETLSPTPVSLSEAPDLEPFEGMLVTVEDELTVAGNYELGRFGQLLTAAGGRPFKSTHGGVAAVGAFPRLLVDDGSTVEHPAGPPYLDELGTRRAGDVLSGVTGVVSEEDGNHVLHPTSAPRFTRRNPRPPAPSVGGSVRVVGFNLFNYFATLGERGASSEQELERQRVKHVAAIEALDADVVGLIELENNGDLALRDLVDALNASAGGGIWAHVPDPGGVLGDNVLRLGYIYRPAAVRPIGDPTADLDPVFKRPPLAQTFEAGAERFTVVVNHFKSKGSCGGAEGADLDAGDGKGCWNGLRTRQSRRLLEFLARLQEETADPDVLVIGDLNAYAGEEPIRVLTAGGLLDLMAAHVAPEQRYSYVFAGDTGYLDYALATPGLAARVTGAAFWHINCDEPTLLDYNTETNPPGLFRPDPYRSSDHDPVLIGLDF